MNFRPDGAGCDTCPNNTATPTTMGATGYEGRCGLNADIAPNVTFLSMVHSDSALSLNLPNCPSVNDYDNFKTMSTALIGNMTAAGVVGINTTSGYRNEAVNNAVGGSATSGHRLGEAMDMMLANDTTNAALAGVLYNAKKAITLQRSQYKLVDAYIRMMGNLPFNGEFHQIYIEYISNEAWIHYHCKINDTTLQPVVGQSKVAQALNKDTNKYKSITIAADKQSITIA